MIEAIIRIARTTHIIFTIFIYSYRFKRYMINAAEQDNIILPIITEPRENE